ncbi:L,D-transpeptidase family protein [Flavobacterium agrisoli]|uniref:L,D-transpeptidase family protein n=1 Tax=Flavobacterium agrisoli TaxID=2793066 RepID=A0A934PMC5_9FLAO|nr:L,D-transpeptidase family protein [Flavobacterium agrisoli]MBK0369111.1 L,D-transpeptidase family protein [Flavobacterium agrisoli]
MKRFILLLFAACMLVFFSCNKAKKDKIIYKKPAQQELPEFQIPIDSNTITNFYERFPKLASYQKDVRYLYQKNGNKQVWLDHKGIIEFGHTLFDKYRDIESEGLSKSFPYNDSLIGLFENNKKQVKTASNDLLISNLYFYYADKVYRGVDAKTTTSLEWLLPRKKLDYQNFIDSLFKADSKVKIGQPKMFSQYYKLREALQKYKKIETNGGWKSIAVSEDFKSFTIGDSAEAILQIRERLVLTGELAENNQSPVCDSTLLAAVNQYQIHHGIKSKNKIISQDIAEMNVPVADRIKTIVVNMERCRWLDPELEKDKEFLAVNIPEFKLYLVRDGQVAFTSPVVVGKMMTQTVIFSGMMQYVVFSPYWNVPNSIINKEIKPGMARDKNYLKKKNLEWNNGRVRQLPGRNNSLGLVKFLFPNSNNIYLHDTPSKSLFERESRAFSHGCVRVGKPRDLAIELLKDNPNWIPEKIDTAMHAGKEKWVTLQHKIPVYIGYFTAWVDRDGKLNFYRDVYQRDNPLAKLLYNEN